MDYLKFLEQHNISVTTKIAAVIGDPIAQSLSPYLHNYWLKQNKIDGVYIPLKVSVAEFSEFIKSMHSLGFCGFNITIPHKESALKLCNFISLAAKQIGAVNTIKFTKKGKLKGYNTDYYAALKLINYYNKCAFYTLFLLFFCFFIHLPLINASNSCSSSFDIKNCWHALGPVGIGFLSCFNP